MNSSNYAWSAVPAKAHTKLRQPLLVGVCMLQSAAIAEFEQHHQQFEQRMLEMSKFRQMQPSN